MLPQHKRLNSGCLDVFASDLSGEMDVISRRMHLLVFQALHFRVTNGELHEEENQKNREETRHFPEKENDREWRERTGVL